MPKAQGLPKEAIAALVKDGMDEDTEAPRDIAPTPVPPSYAPEPAPPAPAAAPMDMTALVQLLASAMQQSGASTAQAIKDGLSDAATMARAPWPENTQDTGISVYSHPLGDLQHPRTPLRCPMFLGVRDEHGRVIPAFEYMEGTLTERERVGLNALRAGVFEIERNDGERGRVDVADQADHLGHTTRVVVAVPFTWLQKDTFAQMPSLIRMLDQMVTAETVAA